MIIHKQNSKTKDLETLQQYYYTNQNKLLEVLMNTSETLVLQALEGGPVAKRLNIAV